MCLNNQNYAGSQNDGNNSLENNTGSVGLNNSDSAFPQSNNGADNQNYAGSQNDGNNNFGINTGSVGLNNNGGAFPQRNGTINHNENGPQYGMVENPAKKNECIIENKEVKKKSEQPPRARNRRPLDGWLLNENGNEEEDECIYKNIDPAGDSLAERHENDGITRIAFHNIAGSTIGQGFSVADEIEAINEFGIDIAGYTEINKPWDSGNKHEFGLMMESIFDQSRTVFSASPADHDVSYQPGGCMLTVNGTAEGRIQAQGSDSMGRFCWYTLRGGRDEGVLVITAYRVCQEPSDNPGPLTAFSQQYTALREAGVEKPNPRKQILKDMLDLINEKRLQGFRPILMMDANGDHHYEKDKDEVLAQFIQDAGLSDVYHNRFPEQINTYVYGKKRLDMILMDPSLEEAVVRIGYLGLHDVTLSDHVLAYVDFDTEKLFHGVINRPMPIHAREFRLEQKDKVLEFQKKVKKEFEDHRISQRIFKLAMAFRKYGHTLRNNNTYQQLDGEIKDIALSAAKSVCRKKYGYMRSPELHLAGRWLILFKMILNCKARHAPFTPAVDRRAEALGIDPALYGDEWSCEDVRKEVRNRRNALWEAQKTCETDRANHLREEARRRALAGDLDEEQELKNMLRIAESRATNRKLTCILKPRSGAIDRIQIPTSEWYYSLANKELYRYTEGNFESHPYAIDGKYYRHHFLKVPPPDAIPCVVQDDGEFYILLEAFDWFYSYEFDTLYRRVSPTLVESYKRRDGGKFAPHRTVTMLMLQQLP